MNVLRILIAVSLSLALSTQAFSRPLTLFNKDGSFAHDYNPKSIDTGDVLQFSDGSHFEVIDFLGEGRTNRVFKVRLVPRMKDVPEFLALRLPINSTERESINRFIDGYGALVKNRVPVTKIYRSSRGQYVATELSHKDFSGHAFFTESESIERNYSPKVLQEAEEALVQFARTTIQFNRIGDLGSLQLSYNVREKKWTLLDWNNNHALAKKGMKQKTFALGKLFENDLVYVGEGNEDLPETRVITGRERRILERIRLAVMAERSTQRFAHCIREQISH